MFWTIATFLNVVLFGEKEYLKSQALTGFLSIKRYEFPTCDPAYDRKDSEPSYLHNNYLAVPYSQWCVMSFVDQPNSGTDLVNSQRRNAPFVKNAAVLKKVNEIEPILDTVQASNVLESSWVTGRSIADGDCLTVGVAESYLVSPLWLGKVSSSNDTPEKQSALRKEAERLLKRSLNCERGPDRALRRSIAYIALANISMRFHDFTGLKDQLGLYRQAIRSAGSEYPFIGLAADYWLVSMLDVAASSARDRVGAAVAHSWKLRVPLDHRVVAACRHEAEVYQAESESERLVGMKRYASLKDWQNYQSLSE